MLPTSTKIFTRPSVSSSLKLHTKPQINNEVNCSIKQSIDTHVINNFGYPKQGATHGYKPEFVMVRTLQRYPNASVRENLCRLHARMAEKFSGMSDEALDWLLGGARLTSLGGANTPEEFRQFLNADPETFTPAQLIAQLEPILTSIGYRARNVPVAEQPGIPETDAQKEMYRVVCEITDGQIVRPISQVYPDKVTGWVSNITQETNLDDLIVCDQDDALSDDEDNLFRGQPDRGIADAYYKTTKDDGQPSWMAEARAQDIYIRRHVSGTGPICMAAVVGLLGPASDENSLPFNNEQEARDFFTALFIPKYLRSDYHSIVETYTGINHFTSENISCAFEGSANESTFLSPQEAEEDAYEAMCRASCNETSEFGVTPREAMKDYQSLIALLKQSNELAAPELEVANTPVFVTEDDIATVTFHDKTMMDIQREITMQQIKVSEQRNKPNRTE
jgi:hypothetical protein